MNARCNEIAKSLYRKNPNFLLLITYIQSEPLYKTDVFLNIYFSIFSDYCQA